MDFEISSFKFVGRHEAIVEMDNCVYKIGIFSVGTPRLEHYAFYIDRIKCNSSDVNTHIACFSKLDNEDLKDLYYYGDPDRMKKVMKSILEISVRMEQEEIKEYNKAIEKNKEIAEEVEKLWQKELQKSLGNGKDIKYRIPKLSEHKESYSNKAIVAGILCFVVLYCVWYVVSK